MLLKTIKNAIQNGNLITIMIVTKFGTIRSTYQTFKEAVTGANVAIIEGNACRDLLVATELKWERLDSSHDDNVTAMPPKHSVILIDLDSIYYNRYEAMKFAYQVN